MTTYSYRSGIPKPPVDAQIAGKELARIAKRDGVINPHVVLDESRDDDAPLHPAFEWDDAIAGEHWRLDQARRIVRAVVIVSDAEEREEQQVYYHVPSQGGYVPSDLMLTRPDLYREAWKEYAARMAAAETQLSKLEQLAPTVDLPRIQAAKAGLQTAALALCRK